MNKNTLHYILTFVIALGTSFAAGRVYAQLYNSPDAMQSAYQAAAAKGQEAVDALLANASQNGAPGQDGQLSEYAQLIELMDQDKADGALDGNVSPGGGPNPGDVGVGAPGSQPETITVYDLSEYDIITDGAGNVTEIKKKEQEEGEDEDGDDEDDEEDGDDQGQGGGAGGGGQGQGGPAGGDDGKFKPSEDPKKDYARDCWYCVKPNACKTGSPGACDLVPCKPEETCADHTETTPDGKNIICHTCSPKPPPPPPACKAKGYSDDPRCGGACKPELCEEIAIAPDGSIRTSTRMKTDLICYRCAEEPECKKRGYYDDPNCAGKCPDTCHEIYFDPAGGIRGPNQTRTKKDLKCYACGDEGEPAECHSGVTDPSCAGMCPPQMCKVVDTVSFQGNVWNCYDCDEEGATACMEKGLYDAPNCNGKCEAGSICVPLRIAPDGGIRGSNQTWTRQDINCYGCLKIKSIEITWIIVIIETPWGRVILDDMFDPSSLVGFSPQSVMAMLTPDNPAIKNIEKLAALAGGKVTAMKAGDIASMLSDMLGKKRKFSDDCFSDVTPQDIPAQQPRVTEEKKKKKKKGEPEEPPAPDEFGFDPMQEAQLDGPVVACGRQGDEDVLVVYDAMGGSPQVVTREELKNNPEKFLGMLVKADAAYKQVMALKDMTPQSLLQQAAHKLAEKIMKPREPQDPKQAAKEKEKREKDKKKKGAEEITPNDPLYWADYGVKKSKVAARLAKAAGAFGGGEEDPVRAAKRKSGEVADQWGLREIGYLPMDNEDSAWNAVGKDFKQPNTLVAVIDSGFDYSHPDGPEFIWTNAGETPDNGIDDDGNGYIDDIQGWNFIDNNTDMRDFNGHGTFVAGIIAAKWNNDEGIAGINPGAVIMPLKVADEKGEGNSLNVFRAINYAVNQGARVINISMGNRGISKLEQAAINRARERGIFVAVASGNFRENIAEFGPAAAHGVFAVGSMDRDGKKSTISNWGPNNGLIAPGEEIYSIRSGDSFDKRKVSAKTEFYYKMSGTSFSTPMVAGTASLILAKNPNLTAREIEDILHNTARDLYDAGWDGESGAGLLDASAALRAAPDGLTTLKITGLVTNRDNRGEVESVDVYATARGPVKEFTVGVGKGARAGSFDTVAGPFAKPAENEWVTRIDKKHMRGSNDWVIALEGTTTGGKPLTARTVFIMKKEDLHDY